MPPMKVLVDRGRLIEVFYSAFREFVQSDRYDPMEWEGWFGAWLPKDQIGDGMRSYRSEKVEAFLAGQPIEVITMHTCPYCERSVSFRYGR